MPYACDSVMTGTASRPADPRDAAPAANPAEAARRELDRRVREREQAEKAAFDALSPTPGGNYGPCPADEIHQTFASVYIRLAEGKAVSRIGFLGYWVWNDRTGRIDMHCKDGVIRHGEDVNLTIKNVLSGGWYVLTQEQRNEFDAIHMASATKLIPWQEAPAIQAAIDTRTNTMPGDQAERLHSPWWNRVRDFCASVFPGAASPSPLPHVPMPEPKAIVLKPAKRSHQKKGSSK